MTVELSSFFCLFTATIKVNGGIKNVKSVQLQPGSYVAAGVEPGDVTLP